MAGESMESQHRFLYKQLHYYMTVSIGFSILFLLFSIEWTTFSIREGVLFFGLIHVLFTVVQVFIVYGSKRQLQAGRFPGTTLKIAGAIALLSLLAGNVFVAISAFYLFKQKRSTAYISAVYMVITDILILLVSALNLFKPYVSNTFLPSMYTLALILLLHLAVLCLIDKLPRLNKNRRYIVVTILLLTSLTGNLFALLTAYGIVRDARIRKWKERENLLDKLVTYNSSMLGLLFIIFLLSISICSRLVFDYADAVNNNYSLILQDPSLVHPFGTDNYGRDVFSRVIFGAQISLVVGFLSTLIPFVIGGALGAFSGYFGGRTDNVIMRLLDILYAIPGILLAITIIAAFGANTVNLILALSVGAIPGYARTMRANVLQVSSYDYVESARALGAKDKRIIWKHVIPNAMAPMIVRSTLTVGIAVISTSSLSYLGLGLEPQIPEWGNILRLGSTYLESQPHLAIFPGIAIILLVLSFNFLGDGLRDATDPRLTN